MKRIRQEIWRRVLSEAYLLHLNGPAPSTLHAFRHVMSCDACKDLINSLLKEIQPEELYDDSSERDELESTLSDMGCVMIVEL